MGILIATAIFVGLQAHIESQIKDLDNNRFTIRQQATENLKVLDELAYPAVKRHLGTKDISLEQRKRLEQVLEHYYTNILPTDWTKLPWIDSLPQEYPNRNEIIQTYLTKARGGNWEQGSQPEYATYREATRLWVRDKLEAGTSKAELIRLMDDHMVPYELKWCKQAQPTYICPIRIQRKYVHPHPPEAELLPAPKEQKDE